MGYGLRTYGFCGFGLRGIRVLGVLFGALRFRFWVLSLGLFRV